MDTREVILDTIKSEMTTIALGMTIQSIDDAQSKIEELFRHAQYLILVPNYSEPSETGPLTNNQIPQPIPVDLNSNIGMFKQYLVHGMITSPGEKDVFIPESLIRENRFKHGDVVRYRQVGTDNKNQPTHEFSLVEEHPEKNDYNERSVFEKGIVQKCGFDTQSNSNIYAIAFDILGEPLIVDGETKKHTLTQAELNSHNLKDGDIVDLAWYNYGFEETARVIWRYSGSASPRERETYIK